MPKGPKDEKRPADVIGNAVKVMHIVVGELYPKLSDFKLIHYPARTRISAQTVSRQLFIRETAWSLRQ